MTELTDLKIPSTIKMIISDFDGIMTDGCVYINEDKSISRKLNFKDIMAISLLKKSGRELAFVSGEKNSSIDLMAEKFDLKEIHQGIRVKIDVVKSIVERNNLKQGEFLYIGDDINDIDALAFSSIRITVPNAVSVVKKLEGIQVTAERGGEGAFREVVDCLLKA